MTEHTKPPDQGKHGKFPVLIAGDDLDFRQLTLSDHRVEADQILREGGYNPTLDHRLVELTFPAPSPGTMTNPLISTPWNRAIFLSASRTVFSHSQLTTLSMSCRSNK